MKAKHFVTNQQINMISVKIIFKSIMDKNRLILKKTLIQLARDVHTDSDVVLDNSTAIFPLYIFFIVFKMHIQTKLLLM